MNKWVYIGIVVVVIVVSVLIWHFTKSKDVSISTTDTPGVEPANVVKPESATESTMSGSTTVTADVPPLEVSPLVTEPETTKLAIDYRGANGDESIDILINGKIVHNDTKVSKTTQTKTFEVTKDNLPVKTVTIRFKNDSKSRDIYIEKASLNGIDIKSKFKYAGSSPLDLPRQEQVSQGLYYWPGNYVYTH